MKDKVFNYIRKSHSASFLELFYDIVIIVTFGGIIEQIKEMLEHGSIEPFEFSFFILEGFTVLIFWGKNMQLSTKFERRHFTHRIRIFVQMIGFLFIAVSSYVEFDPDRSSTEFIWFDIIGYSLVLFTQLIVRIVLYFGMKHKYVKKQLLIATTGLIINTIVFIPWVITFFVFSGKNNVQLAWIISTVIWITNLLILIATDILINHPKYICNVPDEKIKLTKERLSILFIIFLGEFVREMFTSIVHDMKGEPVIEGLNILLGFIIAISFWWVYRDVYNFLDLKEKPSTKNFYVFGTMIIVISFMFMNPGIELLCTRSADHIKIGGIFTSIGLFIFACGGFVIYLSLKKYKKEYRFVSPVTQRIIIFLWPVLLWGINWVGFVYPKAFLYTLSSTGTCFIGMMTITTYLIQKKLKNNPNIFEEATKKYEEKDRAETEKNLVKYIDCKFHQSNHFKINKYSYYAEQNINNNEHSKVNESI